MFRTTLFIPSILGIAFLAVPGFAQSETESYRQDISVQGFGTFVRQTTQNGVENKASDSAGVLATYRYLFSAHHGIEADYG